MMLLWERALPLYVLFLCARGDAPRGLCDDTKCCALFLETTHSAVVERRCQDTSGELYNTGLWGGVPALQPPHGHTWIKFAQNSVALCSDSPQVNRTCTDTVDGYMCQYTHTCKPLLTGEGQYVNYSTALGFEGKTRFVPGTLAVVRVTGQPPVSKHVCSGTEWMRAPWSCEVMSGGCEHECDTRGCSCPAGHTLHPNKFTCTEDPCAKCAHECVKQGGEWECRCRKGFRLESGGHCVDVDECSEDRTLCSGEGEACENEEGTYKCTCKDDYELVGTVCMDASFCSDCEHFCDEVQGSLACVCREGFRVDPQDPTKCELFCTELECPADCPHQTTDPCYCPPGFIQDVRDKGSMCVDIDECEVEAQCDHSCYNTFGGFICECEEGFQLHDKHRCVLPEPILNPVLSQTHPPLGSAQPTALPPYVKTGSILGITVFALLCAALLFCLLHKLLSRVQFYSLKRDMEIFTLQQVSTETYKRLSHDRQFRNECHRL